MTFTNNVFACECEYTTIEEKIINSDAIFTGKIIDVQEYSKFENIANISTHKVWKGDIKDETSVITDISDCRINFTKNEFFLIYARNVDGKLVTDRCDGTKLLNLANDDIQLLDEKLNIIQNNIVWLSSIIIGITVTVFVIIVWKKRVKKT